MEHDTNKKKQKQKRNNITLEEITKWSSMSMEEFMGRLTETMSSSETNLHAKVNPCEYVDEESSLGECARIVAMMVGDILDVRWW